MVHISSFYAGFHEKLYGTILKVERANQYNTAPHFVPKLSQTKTIVHWTNAYGNKPAVEKDSDQDCKHMNTNGHCVMINNKGNYQVSVDGFWIFV